MNIYLAIILSALTINFLLQSLVRILTVRTLSTEIPDELQDMYDPDEYRRSQEYTKANTRFAQFVSTFGYCITLAFILAAGFNYADILVRSLVSNSIIRGLCFAGLLFLARDILFTPFALYRTFVIEEKYGFNTMTVKTFFLDKIKSYCVGFILGGIILALILFFFEQAGPYAWAAAWGAVSLFIILMQPLYVLVIAPLFNTFTPLQQGELRHRIEEYADKVDFPLKEINVMDGSKRSSHSNAYFSGILKKRIVLFDTLIAGHPPEEIVAILAHETGHYKKHHIRKGILLAIIHTGIMFFLLSLFIKNPGLFEAFRMEHISLYAGLVFFGLLYSPAEMILSVFFNRLSRAFEYESDRFAAETIENRASLVSALKNLYADNLSNVTPHPLDVILNYSHPPLLQRIRAVQARE